MEHPLPGMPPPPPVVHKPKRERRPLVGWRVLPDGRHGRPSCDPCSVRDYVLRPGLKARLVPRALLVFYTGGQTEPLRCCLGHAEDLGSTHALVKAEQARRAAAGPRGRR